MVPGAQPFRYRWADHPHPRRQPHPRQLLAPWVRLHVPKRREPRAEDRHGAPERGDRAADPQGPGVGSRDLAAMQADELDDARLPGRGAMFDRRQRRPAARPLRPRQLAADARRDFERMRFPAPNWVLPVDGPDGKPALDVLIIGAGMCGQTLALALARDGVRNARIVDRVPRGREGPWGTYARMDILRSPKHLTGPDLGFPALTFRAWYEAQHGAEGWERLYKVSTADWLAYLLWVRDTAAIAVENGVEAVDVVSATDFRPCRAERRPRPGDRTRARSCWRAGGMARARPACRCSSLARAPEAGGSRVFHSSDDIDFARFKGGTIGVLGASASAFDNAAVALESGAREVRLFSRRPHLPQVNKSKWDLSVGFFPQLPRPRRRPQVADLHLHFRRADAAAARIGAALRPPRRLHAALRRALDRRDPRGRRRHGRHRQGPIRLRCRHHGHGI